MAEPYIGELRLVGFSFPPRGWALCNGQLMSIQQNQALFSLLGTTYGGNGIQTFALPDLRGRIPLHFGQGPGLNNYAQGQIGGEEGVTLLQSQMPAHIHQVNASTATGTANNPTNTFWATPKTTDNLYAATANGTMLPNAVGVSGGSQPHDNIQPSLVLNFIIALQGIFPSRG